MIAELISKLVKRKAEKYQAAASEWQNLVAEFVDTGGKSDPDHVLAKLDRLGRTPEELKTAAELLTQRRGWSATVAAGSAAEAEYNKLTDQAEKAAAELVRLRENHEAKYQPLGDKIRAAHDAINSGADAKRRLLDTAGDAARAKIDLIDQQIRDLETEHQTPLKRIRDLEDWVDKVRSLGHVAATSDLERLDSKQAELAGLREQDRGHTLAYEKLQDERRKACDELLRPELI